MGKSQWYIGTPNGAVLCVDSMENGRFGGRIYHAYSREPIVCSSMDEAVFGLEQLYDSLNFPHPTTDRRTFRAGKQQAESRQEKKRIMNDDELLSKHGDLGNFIIRVQHRQNSSWQGRITWIEENKTVCFRSIWEMIKLVTDALDTVGGKDTSLAQWPVAENGEKPEGMDSMTGQS